MTDATPRKPISTIRRAAIFKAARGVCHICERRIQAGERWEVEHRIPLALGGADDDSNRRPAHEKCHAKKTRDDQSSIARAKRREARHTGAYRSAHPMPGSRGTKFKKRMDGSVVER